MVSSTFLSTLKYLNNNVGCTPKPWIIYWLSWSPPAGQSFHFSYNISASIVVSQRLPQNLQIFMVPRGWIKLTLFKLFSDFSSSAAMTSKFVVFKWNVLTTMQQMDMTFMSRSGWVVVSLVIPWSVPQEPSGQISIRPMIYYQKKYLQN